MSSSSTYTQIAKALVKSQSILLTAHHKLDPDSAGSVLALYRVLSGMGKNVVAVCYETTPKNLDFLPDIDAIKSSEAMSKDTIITLKNSAVEVEEIKYTTTTEGYTTIIVTPKHGSFQESDLTMQTSGNHFDTIIVVDSGDQKNIGKVYSEHTELFKQATVINIDHHPSNDMFGDINLVDVHASSAAELVFYVLKELNDDLIDADVATYLLLGIIADTGSFQHSNTTPEALRAAAELVKRGGRQQEIIKHLFKTKKFSTLKLWGKTLTDIEVDDAHRMLWSKVYYKDLKRAKAEAEDAKAIIDELLSSAPHVDFYILFLEKEPGTISVSIRSRNPKVKGMAIAKHFGGGGHEQACGFTKTGITMEALSNEVLNYVRAYQQSPVKGGTVEIPTQFTQVKKTSDKDLATAIKTDILGSTS